MLCMHNPISFSPAYKVRTRIYSDFNFSSFIQLIIVRIFISIPDPSDSLKYALYTFPRGLLKSDQHKIEFTFLGDLELGGILGAEFCCVICISGCGSAFVALFNFTELQEKADGWSWLGKWVFEAQSPGL